MHNDSLSRCFYPSGRSLVQDYAKLYNVPACEQFDFFHEKTDVFVTGVHFAIGDDHSFCVAMNPLEHTYAVAQKKFAEIKIKEIITLTPEAIGVSGTRGLALSTVGKLWNGEGNPAEVTMPAHYLMRENVKLSIDTTGNFAVDGDPYDAVTQSQGMDFLENQDWNNAFQVLLSGSTYPVVHLLKRKLNFKALYQKGGNVHLLVDGRNTMAQFSAPMLSDLSGLCSHFETSFLCKLISSINLGRTLYGYADKNGAGAMIEIDGGFSLAEKEFNLAFGLPEDGADFAGRLSLTWNWRGGAEVCLNDACVGECSKHSECGNDSYCHAIGICLPKQQQSTPCTDDAACQTGICAGANLKKAKLGVCSACRTIDSSDGCPDNQVCVKRFDNLELGLKCEDKKPLTHGCTSSNACQSNNCVGGFCSSPGCSNIDDSCGNNQVCIWELGSLKCQDKLANGKGCSSDNACSSGICDWGFCRACRANGDGCNSNQYCEFYKCHNKLNKGKWCGFDPSHCKSGKSYLLHCL